jgi:hypothetical protein
MDELLDAFNLTDFIHTIDNEPPEMVLPDVVEVVDDVEAPEHDPGAEGPHNAVAQFRKLADARAICKGQQRVVIQATPSSSPHGYFYVYESSDDVDADAEALHDCTFVRERVDTRFQRLAFVDIDSKRYSRPALKVAWAVAWPDTAPPDIYTTSKGYHCVGSHWVTIEEHRRGLRVLADAMPDGKVDVKAIHGLRLAGSRDKVGPGRKERPIGVLLSATLVQPTGAPLDYEADKQRERSVTEGLGVTAVELAAGVAVLTSTPGAFELDAEHSTNEMVCLNRVSTSHCFICDKEHTTVGAFLIIENGVAMGRAYCNKNSKKAARFRRPGAVDDPEKKYPGPFTQRTGETYNNANGVNPAPEGDYIEGSPCGLGKSKAAWEGIDQADTVLLVSYRKTFSASQGALHGCRLYSDIVGPIDLTKERRVVCQYESLHRVQGTPKRLLLDEMRGIRRQACGGFSSATAWATFARLIKEATQVVILDAYADDDDRAFINEIRGTNIKLIRNVHKPHTSKTITAIATYKDWIAGFTQFLDMFVRQPKEWRLMHRFVVVCQWRKDVEEIASKLETLGLRGKAYHGKTCAVTRAAEFANHAEAWKDSEFIVYNSTLEAGVSIEGPEWATAWVLMRGMGHVEASIQGLHRFRAISQYYSYAAHHNGGGDYPTSVPGLIAAIQEGDRFSAGEPAVVDATENKRGEMTAAAYVTSMVRVGDDYTRSSYAQMWIAHTLEGNRSARFWSARFYRWLAETGFNVVWVPAGAMVLIPPMGLAPSKEPVNMAPAEEITFTGSLGSRTAAAKAEVWLAVLAENGGEVPARNLTASEIHSRDKVALMTEYSQEEAEITPGFADEYSKSRIFMAHRTTKRLTLLGADSHILAVEAMRRLQELAETRPDKTLTPRLATCTEKASRALDALTSIGFIGLEDTREIPRTAIDKIIIENAVKLESVYNARGRLWPEVRKPKVAPTDLRGHLAAVNGILEYYYNVKIVAVNKHCTRFFIKGANWPDDPAAVWRTKPRPAAAVLPIQVPNTVVPKTMEEIREAQYQQDNINLDDIMADFETTPSYFTSCVTS